MTETARPAVATRSVTHVALAAILLLAAALRCWRLDRNGFGTAYYSAGVRSMTESWHNFLFNAFDPAGFVSLDKPPLAFWIQTASAKLFGFHGLSVLLPQVLEGVAAVALIHHIVRHRFGDMAGLLAALFLALTPISVAVDRSSNTDSCLVLVLTLAAWLTIRAAEVGSRPLLLAAMALVAVGFNVKMLAAFVVLPAFAAVYAWAAPVAWRRKLADLALGGVVAAAVALSWVAVFDLTSPENRPYAGSSQNNSMLELAIGHNGWQRFVRPFPRDRATQAAQASDPGRTVAPDPADPAAAPPPMRLRLFTDIPAGPLRLADRHLAGQVGWLYPLAVIGLALALLPRRRPSPPGQVTALVLAGWAASYGLVYSFAGGIFHAYYLVAMAPPVAALAGIAIAGLWTRHRVLLLPAALLTTMAWQAYIESGYLDLAAWDWRTWLCAAAIGGTLAAAIVMRWSARPALAAPILAVGIAALLAIPTAWALSSVLARGNLMLPAANLSMLAGRDDDPRIPPAPALSSEGEGKLAAFLLANRGNERFVLATPNARLAAPIIIRTGAAVMAVGGFSGGDPILTPAEFAAMAASGQVRFALLGGLGVVGGGPEGVARARAFAEWVRANGRPVPAALWRTDRAPPPPTGGQRWRRLQLFDLNPTAGWTVALPS